MKNFLIFFCLLFFILLSGETYFLYTKKDILFPPKPGEIPKPLLVYSFENLKKISFPKTQIILGEKVASNANSFSQMFYYTTPKKPNSNMLENVSGLLNAPTKPGTYPVIVMLRGFVPEDKYTPGIGTEPVAKMLADNGFITLAPDFLGFGKSASGSADSFENRFQTYTTTLSLLSSLQTLNSGLAASYSGTLTADLKHIGIWAHSNGGHVALSSLAISGGTYPTVLWAPVSTSFPYSILYYTDESDDQGKILRKVLAQFETIYNTDVFDPTKYYQWIKAPLDIEQGTSDREVPYWWTNDLTKTLTKNGLSVSENLHPGADHNMLPTSTWNNAVSNTISFFKKEFAK